MRIWYATHRKDVVDMKRIEHKRLAVLLRIGLVIAAAVCAAIFFWFLPELGRGIAKADPAYAWAFWPCLGFAWLFAVPVFWAMLRMWTVFGRIGQGAAFCRENAQALRTVSRLAFFDAALVPAGVITLALLGAGSPGMTVIAMPAGTMVCALVGVMAMALSRLVADAAALQDENDLTV